MIFTHNVCSVCLLVNQTALEFGKNPGEFDYFCTLYAVAQLSQT